MRELRATRRARRAAFGPSSYAWPLAVQSGEEFARVDAVCGIMRARVDAAGFLQVGAKVARGGFLLDDGFFAAWIFEVVDANLEWMKIDVAVGAVARAKAAADAPIFDDDFERIAPADSADGAADHTERIAALAAGRGEQEIFEGQAAGDGAGGAP